MAYKPRLHNLKNQYALQPARPRGWAPEKIIYLRIEPSIVLGSAFHFRFSEYCCFDATTDADLANFCKRLVGNKPAAGRKKQPPAEDYDAPHFNALDFKLDVNAFVVIELDRSYDWYFRVDWDGVSTDNDGGEGPIYFELQHVDDSGKPWPGVGIERDVRASQITASRPLCRFVTFGAVARPDHTGKLFDAMTLYTRLLSPGGRTLDLIIDPDIQNPGGPRTFVSPSRKGRKRTASRRSAPKRSASKGRR